MSGREMRSTKNKEQGEFLTSLFCWTLRVWGGGVKRILGEWALSNKMRSRNMSKKPVAKAGFRIKFGVTEDGAGGWVLAYLSPLLII